MKILALESATDACSVAVEIDGKALLDFRIAPQQHAQLLLPMVDAMLADAGISVSQLDGVAFGCGPGSFTGVRIAAAAAQGIAFGADIGVIPVSSLQALAQSAYRLHNASHVLACFDARMREVYWGAYAIDNENMVQPVQNECVCAPEHVALPCDASTHTWCLLGSGADEYTPVLKQSVGEQLNVNSVADAWPSAQDVLQLAHPMAKSGAFLTAEEAVPVYLRDRVALTEKQRASGERL